MNEVTYVVNKYIMLKVCHVASNEVDSCEIVPRWLLAIQFVDKDTLTFVISMSLHA